MTTSAERNKKRMDRLKRSEAAYRQLKDGLSLVVDVWGGDAAALSQAVRGAIARADRTAAGETADAA